MYLKWLHAHELRQHGVDEITETSTRQQVDSNCGCLVRPRDVLSQKSREQTRGSWTWNVWNTAQRGPVWERPQHLWWEGMECYLFSSLIREFIYYFIRFIYHII